MLSIFLENSKSIYDSVVCFISTVFKSSIKFNDHFIEWSIVLKNYQICLLWCLVKWTKLSAINNLIIV